MLNSKEKAAPEIGGLHNYHKLIFNTPCSFPQEDNIYPPGLLVGKDYQKFIQ